MILLRAMIIFMTLLALDARAELTQALTSPTKSESTFNEYYTISETTPESTPQTNSFSALSEQFGADQFIQLTQKIIHNLLKWTLHDSVRPIPSEDYIRKLHFGRWINDPTDDTCMNTRAKVLVRDSTETVTYRNERKCVVESGRWFDNYTHQELTSSRQIQIDHMVPLKNAYISGAFKWDYKTRCLYANYMGYKNHLIPAASHENMSKGDRGPEKYLPPEASYHCQYVKNWLSIKLIWGLNMNSEEAQAINNIVATYNCPVDSFNFTQKELDDQRHYINENIEFCMINKR